LGIILKIEDNFENQEKIIKIGCKKIKILKRVGEGGGEEGYL
jgi:hypothetical protein